MAAGDGERLLAHLVADALDDVPRPGAPVTFSAEQVVQVVPSPARRRRAAARPATGRRSDAASWSPFSSCSVGCFGGGPISSSIRAATGSRPSRPIRRLGREPVATVCDVHAATLRRLEATSTHVCSSEEMTGIQAREWAAPTVPMRPGRVERREFEHVRHRTLSLIATFQVATEPVVAPSLGRRAPRPTSRPTARGRWRRTPPPGTASPARRTGWPAHYR